MNTQDELVIADEALASIAAITAQTMPEIAGLESGLVQDLTAMFGREHQTVGVVIRRTEDEISVDMYIHVYYGHRIPDIALRLQEKVKTALEQYAQVMVVAVNVYVQKILWQDHTGGQNGE